MTVSHYRQLKVWQRSMDLVETIYSATAGFGADERFGLVSQLRRAAVSVPSNIAEGNARRSTLDYARFISMAMGSIAEMETQIEIASRLGLLTAEPKTKILSECKELGRMLLTLERKLKAYSASTVRESSDYAFEPIVPGP